MIYTLVMKLLTPTDDFSIKLYGLSITLCPKSPSVRGFFASLPVRLLFKYLPHNGFCPVSSLPQCDI